MGLGMPFALLLDSMKTCVLVASRVDARFFQLRGRELERFMEVEHPASRRRDRDFQADRPGRSFDRIGPGRHAMSPEESPHDREAANFARELADKLNDLRVKDGVARFMLVAEPGFLGMLRSSLTDQTRNLVDATVHKDLAEVPDRDLPRHLGEILPS
jgi:protein required for attachment to host cells